MLEIVIQEVAALSFHDGIAEPDLKLVSYLCRLYPAAVAAYLAAAAAFALLPASWYSRS